MIRTFGKGVLFIAGVFALSWAVHASDGASFAAGLKMQMAEIIPEKWAPEKTQPNLGDTMVYDVIVLTPDKQAIRYRCSPVVGPAYTVTIATKSGSVDLNCIRIITHEVGVPLP